MPAILSRSDAYSLGLVVGLCVMAFLQAYDTIHAGRTFDAEAFGIGMGALLGGGGMVSAVRGWQRGGRGSQQIDNPDA